MWPVSRSSCLRPKYPSVVGCGGRIGIGGAAGGARAPGGNKGGGKGGGGEADEECAAAPEGATTLK